MTPLPKCPRAKLLAPFFCAFLIGSALHAQSRTDELKIRSETSHAYRLMKQNRSEEAVSALKNVLNLEPKNRTARLELGYLDLRLGRIGEGLPYLESVLSEEPENAKLRLDVAYAKRSARDKKGAAKEFETVAKSANGELKQRAETELAALSPNAAPSAPKEEPEKPDLLSNNSSPLNQGYADLNKGDRAGARLNFEEALKQEPDNALALKQLGFLDVREKNWEQAAQRFEGARKLDPQDGFSALQLGYIYKHLGKLKESRAAFESAEQSQDSQVRDLATASLKNETGRNVYLDVYASPFYASRFSNWVGFFEAQLGYSPVPRWPVSVYLAGRYGRDSQSREGSQPVIYADNAASVGAGLRIQPFGNLSLAAEVDRDYNLTRSNEHPDDWETNARVVLSDYYLWSGRWYGPLGLMSLGKMKSNRAFTDWGASLGYYQRYRDNWIGMVQGREGFVLWSFKGATLSAYSHINLVKDSKKDFYNNLAEVGPGVEIRPFRFENLSLRGEYVRGFYFGIEGRDPNPYDSQYNDFRVLLLYGRRF